MKYLLLCILGLFANNLIAQTPVNWVQLSEVRFSRGMDLSTGYLVDRPRFSKRIKSLENKRIEISGYMLPIDLKGEAYALSRYPYSACFFCGGAGLESVIEIWFLKDGQQFKLDQRVTLKGKLRLNPSGDGLIYLLEQAEVVK
ncbi:MAG: DUF3299 domain-containing protein [Bacteroidia bacterium]|nr:DUF3299 domain-containing protein [Bacteroidia bacterium]